VTGVLPEYSNPPVVQMSLGIHFDELPDVRAAHLGVFAEDLATAGRFAWDDIEEDWPAPIVIEQFAADSTRPPFRLQIADELPPPRTILRDASAHRSLAMQRDSLEYSWWKDASHGTYPRYSALVEEFLPLMAEHSSFMAAKQLGQVRIRQVEVVYRNALQRGVDWPAEGSAAQILRTWTPVIDATLPDVEDAHFAQTHVLRDDEGQPHARLYISLDTMMPPPFRRAPDTDWASLTLTYRGLAPAGVTPESVKPLLGAGREAIVRSFTSVTTPDAHERWRRTR